MWVCVYTFFFLLFKRTRGCIHCWHYLWSRRLELALRKAGERSWAQKMGCKLTRFTSLCVTPIWEKVKKTLSMWAGYVVYTLSCGFSLISVSCQLRNQNLALLGLNFQMAVISWVAPFKSLFCHSLQYSLLSLKFSSLIHISWWAPGSIFFTSVWYWNGLLSGEPDSYTISLECPSTIWCTLTLPFYWCS